MALLGGLLGSWGRRRHERAGFTLYAAAVAAARAPFFYEQLGVPDSLDGRFDLVGLHSFLVIRTVQTLPPPGAALAQAVFDAMFSDMDMNLREMGVGDLGVGRRVKLMWEAFHGRSAAYQTALAIGDHAALASALARNVWRDESHDAQAGELADIVVAQDRHLASQDPARLARGLVEFLPVGGTTARAA